MANSQTIKNSSPLPPSPGNVNSVFFTGGDSALGKTDKLLPVQRSNGMQSRNRSPSPNKNKPNISITIDHAEDSTEQFGINGLSPSPNVDKSRGDNYNGNSKGGNRKSRKDSHVLSRDPIYERKYIYDRELISRQQVMIAFQPMTGIEEIDYKRDMLRIKVENRKRAEALSTSRSRATTSLDTFTASSKSQPGSRSPSPAAGRAILSVDNTSEYQISKKLADSTSQAIKVTKKVSSINKKLTPKINAKIPKK
ncbi:uncharacterized protein LOC110843360 isoform X2 [Folsomia candida]|uniref:uncharacterized protein LOC110843360 isoform X2 n=1 Tax=Folsomia candida TaxID=158441 RepID=UPI001605049E|nr:uncharacterized protein LOC110843360 isoform X2 [Folsomia candida]